MILLGDANIVYETLSSIKSSQDIISTQANSTLIFEYNIDLIKYCHKNALGFAVIVKDIKEVIYTSQFDVKYILCNKDIVNSVQKIAENYMFDAKILVIIDNSDEIVWVAQNEIDGAIYNHILTKQE
ncbi:hypothetical protein A9Q76_04585 [Arcobacter sp. 31_11_sub10_T18]|nr:hypothetical protein A9Q76_04585 [Arcobacter sp. 31_11_sub10_T18]